MRERGKEKFSSENKSGNKYQLILFNDNINSFQFVIESLIEVCGHEVEQAEQCALLTHLKGSTIIRSGSLNSIESLHKDLLKKGLTVEIQ